MSRKFASHLTGWLLAGAVLITGAGWIGLLPKGTVLDGLRPEERFVRSWKSKLLGCRDASSARAAVRENEEGGEVIPMDDGSWVAAVMEHACCTGAGFNATIYVTSSGEAFEERESQYCGWLAFQMDHDPFPRTSAREWLAAARAAGKPLKLSASH